MRRCCGGGEECIPRR
ncbi:E3 ubiquitin-protein ligase SIS3 [Zea mays]|uniref:E3 ubiquitin-protein ligase SIS3 n=1 Tax=Zea mays TaxID=4577 RepID=A0A1D6NN24_MAIZE|nr:E3 ubiquitin-protein ligase SIS3 [Zea mays]